MSNTQNEELQILRNSLRSFLTNEAPVSQIRKIRDSSDEKRYSSATWNSMAEMGLLGVLIPETFNGVNLGYNTAGLIAEEMGKTLTASPYLSTAVIGASAINLFGSKDQKDKWLREIVSGNIILSLATDESSHHSPRVVKTQAKRCKNGFKISGQKTFVADGNAADFFICSARTNDKHNSKEGITLFIIPSNNEGVSTTKNNSIDSRNSSTVNFKDVQVDSDSVLLEVDSGYPALEKILDIGRACIASEMIGLSEECLERTIVYLKDRKQFGVSIGSFQSLQHRASHLYTEIEMSKSLVGKTLTALDEESEDVPLMVAAAKAKAGQVCQLASQEAIQMHGGVGMTDEYDIGFFIKRAKVANAFFGDTNFHIDRFANLRGY